MQEYTRRLFREVWWAVTPALVFAGMATLALTVSLSVLGRRDRPYREVKVATHVIDYTAADGAATETYTDASPIAFVGTGSKIKLTGTEDSEEGTWVIPTSRIEEIDP